MNSGYSNKFYKVFGTLSDSERKEFCEFLRLSFIKKTRLSEIIIDKIESGTDLHAYFLKKYTERSLWNIYSELTGSLEQFLSLKEIMTEEAEAHRLKRNQFRKRDLSKLLVSDHKINIKKLKSSEFNYRTLNEIQRSAFECLPALSRAGMSKEFSEMYKTYSDYNFMNFYFELISELIEKKIRMEFYNDNTVIIKEEFFLKYEFHKVLKTVDSIYPEYSVIFEILFKLYSAVNSLQDITDFKEARKVFIKNKDLFSDYYKNEMYHSLLNVCTLIAQKTKKNLDGEIFMILKSKLDSGLTDDLKNSKIGGNHFRDYVYIALNLNEDKWAEEFINEYSQILPEELRENNLNTAFAFLNLKRKNYKDAVKFITKLKRVYYIHDLDYYTVQIFAYYDSGNILECLKIKKRFHDYLNRNSGFPESHKKGSENFLKILNGLIRYKETGRKKILDDLEHEYSRAEELFWRKWLSEKINEAKS